MSKPNNKPQTKIHDNQTDLELSAASFARILGAWLYDFLLLCAVWLVAGILYIIPAQMFIKVDSRQTQNLSTTEFTGPVFYTYLFILTWFFFAWFWRHGGQTLGLRTWSLKLQSKDGYKISWLNSMIRFVFAGFPWIVSLYLYDQLVNTYHIDSAYSYLVFLTGFIGLLWIVFDKQNRSLQDIVSKSRIVKLPKIKKSK